MYLLQLTPVMSILPPGVIVNEADNIADEQDFIHLLLTFRVEDEPYWVQGVEVPFTMSATYVSDYTRTPVLLVDDSIVMTVVEPQLSLRVEVRRYTQCVQTEDLYYQKEDNKVHGSNNVHGWKICNKTNVSCCKKVFKNRDNRAHSSGKVHG